MNLIDHFVISIESEPYKQYNHWFVDVIADCYGTKAKSSIMFDTYDKALKVKIGDTFLA